VAAAQAILRGSEEAPSSDPGDAGLALDSADAVLRRMEESGFVSEAAVLRRDHVHPLRKRIAAGTDIPSPPSASAAQSEPPTP
jgi:hypothetical protein